MTYDMFYCISLSLMSSWSRCLRSSQVKVTKSESSFELSLEVQQFFKEYIRKFGAQVTVLIYSLIHSHAEIM